MSKKSNHGSPSIELTSDQKKSFLPKLSRLISKLERIDVGSIVGRNDPRVTSADAEIDGILVDMFGVDSPRHQSYSVITPLDASGIVLYGRDDVPLIRNSVSKRLPAAIEVLQSIKSDFEADIEDSIDGNKDAKMQNAYSELALHPRIAEAANALYQGGHYAQAVEGAAKALIIYVKEKSGQSNLDGTKLMQHVFSVHNPILKFNDCESTADKDEQQGFMHLFTGAVLGIRNPRAHTQMVDGAGRALEFIGFISLLAKYLDAAASVA